MQVNVRMTLTGTTPLLMHNIRLNDREDQYARAIAAVTAKRKKTDDDHREVAKWEWFGGLYTDDEGKITVPTRNVRRSLIEAGKITRQGTQVQRGLIALGVNALFEYDGPRDLDELYARAEFSNRDSVGIGTKRIMRVRPQFVNWALSMDALLLGDVIDMADVAVVGQRAGQAIGLGDNRVNGFGKFGFNVEAL